MSNEATQLFMIFSRTQFCHRRLLGWWPTHLICSYGCSQMQLLSNHFQYSWNTRLLKVIFLWRIPDGTITFAKQANRPPESFNAACIIFFDQYTNILLYWENWFTYSDSFAHTAFQTVVLPVLPQVHPAFTQYFFSFRSVSASGFLDSI